MTHPAAVPVADQLVEIFADLRVAAGVRARKAAGPVGPLLAIVLIWLTRTFGFMDGIATRWHAGTLTPPKSRNVAAERKPADPASRKPRAATEKLPRLLAWLRDLLGEPADIAAEKLRAVLDDPELPTLLAAYPPLAGKLRRVCRALAVPFGPLLRRKSRLPQPVPHPMPEPVQHAPPPRAHPNDPPPPQRPEAQHDPRPGYGPPPPGTEWTFIPTELQLLRAELHRRRQHALRYGI